MYYKLGSGNGDS